MANKGAPTVCSPQVKGKMRRKHPGGGMHHRCTLAGLPASMAFRWRKSPCRPSLNQKNTASRGRMAQICGKSKKSEQARVRGGCGGGTAGTPVKTRGVRGRTLRRAGRRHPPGVFCQVELSKRDHFSVNIDSRGAGRGRAGAGAAMSRGPAPEERPDSRPRRRPNGFRCSPGTPGGRKTRFGAVLAIPLAAKRVSVQPTLHRPRRALGLPAYFVVKTTERAIWPRRFGTRTAKAGNPSLGRSQSLHRNSSGCHAGRDCCTETRLAARQVGIAAPKPVWLPNGVQSPHRNSPGCRPARRTGVLSSRCCGARCRRGDAGRAGTSAGWSYPPKESRATGRLGMSLFSRLSSKPSASGAR